MTDKQQVNLKITAWMVLEGHHSSSFFNQGYLEIFDFALLNL